MTLITCGAVAEDVFSTAEGGSVFFAQEWSLAKHWSLGVSPFSGKAVPSVESPDDAIDDGCGLRIGAYWSWPGRARLSLEIPVFLGRLPQLSESSSQQADTGMVIHFEPHVMGTLTFTYLF